VAAFDKRETAKLRAWSEYLSEGGLDRPVDAIPFDLIDLDDTSLELVEFLGAVLTLAVMSNPAEAAEAMNGFLGDPTFEENAEEELEDAMKALPLSEALDRLDATDAMLTNSAALVGLLSMWYSDTARPMQPSHTLRKMILEPEGNQWDHSRSD